MHISPKFIKNLTLDDAIAERLLRKSLEASHQFDLVAGVMEWASDFFGPSVDDNIISKND